MNTNSPPCPEAWQGVFLTDCIIIMKAHADDDTPRQLVLLLAANNITTAEQLWNTPLEDVRAIHRMTEEMVILAVRLKDTMLRMEPIWLPSTPPPLS